MTRKDSFTTGYHYHVYNRGVDKRNIFKSKSDYARFLDILERFNSSLAANNTSRDSVRKRKEGLSLVKIHAHCLMPNHYHLILEQLVDNGISKFLQKVMTGYTMYFNLKHERSGVLFQGKTKSKLILEDEYLRWLKQYIALNPLDLHTPNWKENGIQDHKSAINFLKDYTYRSEYDYNDCDLNGFIKELQEDTWSRSDLDQVRVEKK